MKTRKEDNENSARAETFVAVIGGIKLYPNQLAGSTGTGVRC